MKDKEYLENTYRRAVEKLTPDLTQKILQKKWEPMQEADALIRQEKLRSRSGRLPYYAGALAAAALVFLSAFFFRERAYAVIEIDVNPGIRLTVDEGCRILGAEGVNEDGRAVLQGTQLIGQELEDGLAQVFSGMAQQAFLTGDGDEILVSVLKKKAGGGDILDLAGSSVKKALEREALAAAVYVQEVNKTAGLERLSREQGISLGKAQLISYLQEKDESAAVRELAQQPVQKLLSQVEEKEKNVLFYSYRSDRTGAGKDAAGQEPAAQPAVPGADRSITEEDEDGGEEEQEDEKEVNRPEDGKRGAGNRPGVKGKEEDIKDDKEDGNKEEDDKEDDDIEDDKEVDEEEDGVTAPPSGKTPVNGQGTEGTAGKKPAGGSEAVTGPAAGTGPPEDSGTGERPEQEKPDKDKPEEPEEDSPEEPVEDSPEEPERDSPEEPEQDKPEEPERDKPEEPEEDSPEED